MRLILFIIEAILLTLGFGFILFFIPDPFVNMMPPQVYDYFTWSYFIVFPGILIFLISRLKKKMFPSKKSHEAAAPASE